MTIAWWNVLNAADDDHAPCQRQAFTSAAQLRGGRTETPHDRHRLSLQ